MGKLICVELHPAGLQTLYLASLQTEKKPENSDRDISGLPDRESHVSEVKGPGATPPLCIADSRQSMAAIFATPEEEIINHREN